MSLNENLKKELEKYIEENYIPKDHVKLKKCGIQKRRKLDSLEKSMMFTLNNVSTIQCFITKDFTPNINTTTWQEELFLIIDKKINEGTIKKDSDIYTKAGVSRQTFSKIRSNKNYHPEKDTAICFCIALELNLDESLDLLEKAGYTLSNSIERDVIIKYFVEKKVYSIPTIDEYLDDKKYDLLGNY